VAVYLSLEKTLMLTTKKNTTYSWDCYRQTDRTKNFH